MSELRIFYRDNGRIKISKEMNILKDVSLSELLWIDLVDVTVDVESELEQFLKIYIQEEEEMEEIEISSRYIETEDSIVANSKFLLDTFEEENVSFILKNNILVSVRSQHLRSFNETVKKLFASPRNYTNGYNARGGNYQHQRHCRYDRGYDTRHHHSIQPIKNRRRRK